MANTALEKQPSTTVNVPERTDQSIYYTPLCDIIETHDGFTFQADLPGVKPGDVDVTIENGVLTISAKVQPRQPEDQSYLWHEYGVGHFYRSFQIGAPIQVDGITAELTNGVLSLYVPKAESAHTRKIAIKG